MGRSISNVSGSINNGSYIKSIQRGLVDVRNADTTPVNVPHDPVKVEKTIIRFYENQSGDIAQINTEMVPGELQQTETSFVINSKGVFMRWNTGTTIGNLYDIVWELTEYA